MQCSPHNSKYYIILMTDFWSWQRPQSTAFHLWGNLTPQGNIWQYLEWFFIIPAQQVPWHPAGCGQGGCCYSSSNAQGDLPQQGSTWLQMLKVYIEVEKLPQSTDPSQGEQGSSTFSCWTQCEERTVGPMSTGPMTQQAKRTQPFYWQHLSARHPPSKAPPITQAANLLRLS